MLSLGLVLCPLPDAAGFPSLPASSLGCRSTMAVLLSSWMEHPHRPAYPCPSSLCQVAVTLPHTTYAPLLCPSFEHSHHPGSSGCQKKILINTNFKHLHLVKCGFLEIQPLKCCKFHRDFVLQRENYSSLAMVKQLLLILWEHILSVLSFALIYVLQFYFV